MRLGLSRYRGSRRCHRLGTVRIWVTPETSPPSLATDPRSKARAPPWTRQRPTAFGNHSFSIIEIRH
jgi:hypothetical protein